MLEKLNEHIGSFSSRSGSRTGIQLTSIFLALAKKSNGHRPINVNRLCSWVEHYVPTDLLTDVVGSPLVFGQVFF